MNSQRMEGVKALVFSAGLGTRFKPWTDHHPKALALVNGKSLLERNIAYLQRYGITDVVVNVHHFADQIEAAVAENNGWGSSVTISDERNEVLETGGGLLKALPLLEEAEHVLTLNVDILTDLDLNAFHAFHLKQNAGISLAVTNRITSRNLLFSENGRLCGWRNNQTGEEIIKVAEKERKPMAFSGIAFYNKNILSSIRQTGKFSVIETFLDLAPQKNIYAYDHSGSRWVDVGKPESVQKAEAMFP